MLSPRTRHIIELSLPIMGGMVSQNVMNLVDTAMVGSLGETALAAVGMSSFAAFMAQAFLMGLSYGVQAMAARRMGEGKTGIMAVPLNGGLLLAVGLGIPISMVLFALAPSFYPFLVDDPAVIAEGVPYLRARLCAVVAVGMNFAFRGYFNGVNLSKVYLRSLITMNVCNGVLNYVLIFGKLGFPALGALGAGIGSAIATYVGSAVYVGLGIRHAREAGFMSGIPDRQSLRVMLQQSVPSGIRQFFFASGMTALFWIIGRVSTTALAAGNVLVNLMLVAILPSIGLGMAAASLVGQALGRNDPDDAKQWGWDVTKIAVAILALIGLPMLLAPEQLLGAFTDDAATIAAGTLPLRISGAVMFLDGIGMVLQSALLGAGDSRRIMFVAVALQWVVFLPVAYLIGPVLGLGLIGIWLTQAAYRALQAGTFAAMWARGGWTGIRV